MTTLIVKGRSSQSQQFLAYAKTLPYVDVLEENGQRMKRFKPEVEKALLKSECGEELTRCENIDEMFKQLGI